MSARRRPRKWAKGHFTTPETRSLRPEAEVRTWRSMLRCSNRDTVPLDSIVGCLLRTSVVVGTVRGLGLLDKRMPLFFGIKYGHLKFWIAFFDSERRFLGRIVRFVSGLQLPIDCNIKWFGKGWSAELSNLGNCPIGNGRPCLPGSI